MSRSTACRSLVIDACIAHACCSKRDNLCADDTSKICRNFLQILYEKTEICIVMTKPISEEWKNHMNKFSRKWIRWMHGRKRVVSPDQSFEPQLREKLEANEDLKEGLSIMLKDLCLIDAAIVTDKIMASLDDTSRYHFAKASLKIDEIGEITWINPSKKEEDSIKWILNGAMSKEDRFIMNQI